MSTTKTKAIFYAYSNNALDHLAPYAILCKQKKIDCTVIYGEDFIRHKVKPKKDIVKILQNENIEALDVSSLGLKGFLHAAFLYLWLFTKAFDKNSLAPVFLIMKLKGLCERVYRHLDGDLIGKHLALKLSKDYDKIFIFTDEWSKNKKIQNSFLTYFKNKAKIISIRHDVYHFHHPKKNLDENICEDMALLGNKWELEDKNHIKYKEVIGNLRFSKRWIDILDKYSTENFSNDKMKKNVLIVSHNQNYTSDWKRMFDLFNQLVKREDINLKILPHIRGMSNLQPPKELKEVWDRKTSLDASIKKSDIVIFWVSSGFFEAVVRNKKILYLSFLSNLDDKFIWRKNAPSNIIIKNEVELNNAIDNYKKDNKNQIENSCFEELIWPKGDPWENTSNFLNSFLK